MTSRPRPTRDVVLQTLSHELNTTLTTILGNIRLLKTDDGPGVRAITIKDLEQSAQRLNFALQNLLLLERLELGEQPYLEPVVLPILLSELLGSRCTRCGRHQIVGPRGNVSNPVAIDRNLFRVCLNNLVDNACLYSPPEKPIVLITGESGRAVLVSVLDEGLGIEEEELSHIFEPYYRSPKVSDTVPGLGIGLTVAKRIMELHGGTLGASNRPEGGAILDMSLPGLAA